MSLSARRAWIEIDWASVITAMTSVALRKESVDRNSFNPQQWHLAQQSLSARRAWIEIAYGALDGASEIVALRKESVDRNQRIAKPFREQFKVALRKESVDRNLITFRLLCGRIPSLSARRAWIEIIHKFQKPKKDRRRSPQGERG